ncbi:MAG: hypothetical protein NWF07_08130 [Candidatus Bathyarchaeota archaeon]|nr:hypothetical protein [Candidatus Bathyarchaeota archaeon]
MKRALLPLIIIASLSFSIVNALEIEQVGVYDFGVAYDVAVEDDIAYLSGNDGVDIFNITDKTSPVKLTRITNTPNGALGLYITENILYISATSNGLKIADVSDPAHPEVVGTVSEVDGIEVYVCQEYAYVASGTSFSIIDVTDPSNPERLSTVHGNERVYKIHAVDDTLYIGEVNQGLLVYDITDPTDPEYIRTVSGTTGIFDMDSQGDTLYLGCHGNGVKILDITDRQNPQIIGSHNNGGEAYGICIVDDLLMVADLQQGIEILDVSNPRSPTLEARWTTTHPHEIAGDTEYVYLADQDDGLEIFRYGEDVEPVEMTEPETEPEQQEENGIPVHTWHIVSGLIISVALLRKHAHQLIH